MEHVSELDVSRALIVGDQHGNLFSWERHVLPAFRKSHAEVILQVGDFGYGWHIDQNDVDVYLETLDEMLEEECAEVLWLDGNHENYTRLEAKGHFPNKTTVQQTSERTWYLPRGYTWEWNGIRCMALGGAYSVDKEMRVPGVSWWPQEELTDEDVKRACAQGSVDVLFAHDAILEVQVPNLPTPDRPDPFRELCGHNRSRVSRVAQATGCELFAHGHMHYGYSDYDGMAPEVVGLDCEDEARSCVVIDFAPDALKWEWAD